MSGRFDQLTARHDELRLRTAIQRRRLAETSIEITQRLQRADRGINFVRGITRHPLMIASGMAVLTMLGPRRLLRWATRSTLLAATGRRLLRLRSGL